MSYEIVDNNTAYQSRHETLEEACQIARATASQRKAPMYVLDERRSEVACFDGGSGQLGYTYDPTSLVDASTTIQLRRFMAGEYHVLDATTKEPIGLIYKSGTDRDGYPWSWSFEPDVSLSSKARRGGEADTLRSAKEAMIYHYSRQDV
jgi:hypothetical protein